MIELQHLTVGYGEKAVLTDISQTLAAGQMVSLLGANGAGKSTPFAPWRASSLLLPERC